MKTAIGYTVEVDLSLREYAASDAECSVITQSFRFYFHFLNEDMIWVCAAGWHDQRWLWRFEVFALLTIIFFAIKPTNDFIQID